LTCTPQAAKNNSDIPQEEQSDAVNTKDADKPPPPCSVLTRPVLLSVANYAMVVLLEMICLALFPPNWSTTVEFGGLGLSPASIGSWMSTWGCMDGIFQFAVIPRVVDRFGLQRVFITCVASCAVVVIMFPLENLVLRQAVGDSTTVVRPLIFLQLLSFSILRMGYCESLSVYSPAFVDGRVYPAIFQVRC